MKKQLLVITFALFFITSCASIVHGPTQPVSFISQPSGATILINGKEYGKTPQVIELRRMGRERGADPNIKMYDVQVLMDGYYPYEFKITREMDGWFLGNILLGGLIGIIVDASNGAMYKLTPSQVIAQMQHSTASSYSKDDELYFAVSLKVNPEWVKIGQLEKAN